MDLIPPDESKMSGIKKYTPIQRYGKKGKENRPSYADPAGLLKLISEDQAMLGN